MEEPHDVSIGNRNEGVELIKSDADPRVYWEIGWYVALAMEDVA